MEHGINSRWSNSFVSLTGTVAMATLPVRLSFKEEANPEWCVTGHLEQKMVRINSVPLSPWNCSLGHKQWERTCTGLPKYFNISPASFDSQHSLNEGTIFDNWHYPVSCSHRNGYWWIAFVTQGCRRQIDWQMLCYCIKLGTPWLAQYTSFPWSVSKHILAWPSAFVIVFTLRSLSTHDFWATHVNRKRDLFAFNIPKRYQNCIANCLYCYRKDLPANLGKPIAQECKMSTSGWKTSLLKLLFIVRAR